MNLKHDNREKSFLAIFRTMKNINMQFPLFQASKYKIQKWLH